MFAENRDVFIRAIAARVDRLADGSAHDFDWVAFRPYEVRPSGDEILYEVPGAFMLGAPSSRRYHITFQDAELAGEVANGLRPLREAWDEAWQERSWPIFALPHGTPIDETTRQFEALRDQLHQEFLIRPEYGAARNGVEAVSYFRAGHYRLTFEVRTRKSTFRQSWRFTLSDHDDERLRGNSIVILWNTLNIPNNFPRYIAMIDYQPDSPDL